MSAVQRREQAFKPEMPSAIKGHVIAKTQNGST
jgi:hypothetical protein